MKKIAVGVLAGIGSIIVVGALVFAGSEVMQAPPSNLAIMADHVNKQYTSPECLSRGVDYESSDFEAMTFQKANDLGYEYDSTCTYESLYPSRNNLWDFVGTKLGFLKPLNWKWNEDGTWNPDVFEM